MDEECNTAAVKGTCVDAATCKWSASQLGYISDPYIQYFVKEKQKKMPIINRGYYARSKAIEQLLDRFMHSSTGQPKQIIVLGSGHDTNYFRLLDRIDTVSQPLRYIELDFPDIIRKKIRIFRQRDIFWKKLGFQSVSNFDDVVSKGVTGFSTSSYSLISCDLRDLQQVENALNGINLDTRLPTLILSECVLIYMEVNDSDGLLSWLGKYLSDAFFVLYEQIKPKDPFGQTMVRNIAARGCDLKSIHAYPTCQAQVDRFLHLGFNKALCWDMKDIYYRYIDKNDRLEKESLEIFDELEEYHLIQEHYCILIAAKSPNSGAILECWFE